MDDHDNEHTIYKILVKQFDGRIFTYTVSSYEIVDSGAFIQFRDRKQGVMRVPIVNTEIRVEGDEVNERSR